MREFVRIGSPEQVLAFRASWIDRAQAIATGLRLPHRLETASDPFFGRVGQLMAANQLEHALKFELLVPLRSADEPTACNCSRLFFDCNFGEVVWKFDRRIRS